MNRFIPTTIIILLAATALLAFGSSGRPKMPPPAGIAVVELFTSEGCSSCPPADAALAAALKDFPAGVYVLGYHVDYWDRLGWKDPFSNAAWTDRQSRYATRFKLTSIYTPEAVVNGKTEFTGSDKNRLYQTIENELKSPATGSIQLNAKLQSDKSILVSYKAAATGKYLLHIALVQGNADTNVKKGENEGKRLHHVNIVRDLKTAADAAGAIVFHLPEALPPGDCSIIAFLQDNQTLAITAAAAATIH